MLALPAPMNSDMNDDSRQTENGTGEQSRPMAPTPGSSAYAPDGPPADRPPASAVTQSSIAEPTVAEIDRQPRKKQVDAERPTAPPSPGRGRSITTTSQLNTHQQPHHRQKTYHATSGPSTASPRPPGSPRLGRSSASNASVASMPTDPSFGRMTLDGAALIVQVAALNKLLQGAGLPVLPKTLAPGPPSPHDLRETLTTIRSLLSHVHHASTQLADAAAAHARLRADHLSALARLERAKRDAIRGDRERNAVESRARAAESALRASLGRCRDLEGEIARVRKDFRVEEQHHHHHHEDVVSLGRVGGGLATVAAGNCVGCGARRGAKGVGPVRKWGVTCCRCVEVWRRVREEQEAARKQEINAEAEVEVEVEVAGLHEGCEVEVDPEDEDEEVEEVVVVEAEAEVEVAVEVEVARALTEAEEDALLPPEELEAKVLQRASEVARRHAEAVGTPAAIEAARTAEGRALYASAMAAVAASRREKEAHREAEARKAAGLVSEEEELTDDDEDEDDDLDSSDEEECAGKGYKRGMSSAEEDEGTCVSLASTAVNTPESSGTPPRDAKVAMVGSSPSVVRKAGGLVSVPFRMPKSTPS
ncbi:hypothetical protein HK101_000377 [Irineochytrium annulatum]|nr:hypothetical protein HK101_000377 [Irineochytrium annulatum]